MIQKVDLDFLVDKKVNLYIKRLDLIDQPVTGNKWYKLKYNIQQAHNLNADTLVTFGGAFSNHLFAFAKACKVHNLKGIAYVRGDGPDKNNPTLRFLMDSGMVIHFLSRDEYRQKSEVEFIRFIKERYPNSWIIPEGGSNEEGFKGACEIMDFDESKYDILGICAGTGCTAAGIINQSKTPVEVYSALKGGFMERNIQTYLTEKKDFEVFEEFNFGGFARTNKLLIDFINDFYDKTMIPLDPIYNGKMMYGIINRIQNGIYDSGSNILAIHTGGLQGILGHNYIHPGRKIQIPASESYLTR